MMRISYHSESITRIDTNIKRDRCGGNRRITKPAELNIFEKGSENQKAITPTMNRSLTKTTPTPVLDVER